MTAGRWLFLSHALSSHRHISDHLFTHPHHLNPKMHISAISKIVGKPHSGLPTVLELDSLAGPVSDSWTVRQSGCPSIRQLDSPTPKQWAFSTSFLLVHCFLDILQQPLTDP